jgi:hypothetical protein
LSVTRGSVSGLDRTIPINGIARTKMVQTDAPINPGNSGGPLMTDAGLVVGLVDLTATQANGLAFAVSAAVAAPLIQSWTTAPQPVSTPSCSQYQATPPATPTTTTPTSLTYQGADFTIDYPASWIVSHIHEGGGNLDSTFQPPAGGGFLLRVDENPHTTAANVDAAAAPVIAKLRSDPTYRELGISHETFDGIPALVWEFEDTENGIPLHKVDVFFIDSSGRGWGLLIQAEQDLWAQAGGPLENYLQTFTLH